MNGVLLVDKPAGWTSHDVVAKVRSILRQAESQKLKAKDQPKQLSARDFQLSASSPKVKAGHTGTLDPFATGLLVLVVGSYTKRAGEFSKLDKTYEAELTLGATSSTGDQEGKITPTKIDKKREKIQRSLNFVTTLTEVLKSFQGELWQRPHRYSAIKVGGQRAYKLARQGKEIEFKTRSVKIFNFSQIRYDYPKLSFTVKVSSGTYIRSLAEDIGQKLGTSAYLSTLRRTKVGKFDIKDALSLDEINRSNLTEAIHGTDGK